MEQIVEIFKTNIEDEMVAKSMIESLQYVLPNCKINFDLDDPDNILRIAACDFIDVDTVQNHLYTAGYSIFLLD